uniref:HTH CENPB-type domain-containing protein n=1 Tax=Meloidogyne incognita TaxID=6306 RepID=A0A914KS34_MELIC
MQLLDVLESAVLLLLTGEHKKGSYASGGRSLRFMESDEQLANWVRERPKEKVRVTRRMIQQQAIKMFPLDDEMKFKASIGWLSKFMERHKA